MAMIRHIVAPIDFSKGCEVAARHAQLVADQFEADLTFLHVVPDAAGLVGDGGTSTLLKGRTADQDLDEFYESRLSEFIEKVGADSSRRPVLLRGDPTDEIEKFCREQNADLVVMPTHGYGRFRQFLIGSVTAKILHDLNCPVFTGAHFETQEEDPKPYRHVACAVDWSDEGEELLKWAWEFSRCWKARFTAIHAVPTANYGYERSERARAEHDQASIDPARARMTEMMDRLLCTGVVEVGVGGVAGVVSSIAKKIGADVLIVGRGEAKQRSSRLATHTYGMVREAPCPVISV